jgi:hypothetical protein
MADSEDDLAVEQLIEQLAKLKRTVAKLPPEYRPDLRDLDVAYEKMRRSRGLPPDSVYKIDPE